MQISPLLTDLYQLTMAYGYWKLGLHEREAVFQQIFRHHPFKGHYAIACGLHSVIEFLKNWHFAKEDIAYLQSLSAANGEKLFSTEFLHYLKNLHFSCDVAAVPEGTLVFANEPLIQIKGPLLQAQLLETTLLNILNFQTLIATKASRVYQAAAGDAVLEFGLRRAQGPDGGLSASRAAYIGGCAATSNVLAGQLYDIPVKGTHAHSWVSVFTDELSAFEAYAEVLPHNAILLVDTYDTIQGINNAIKVGKQLREKGYALQGIRLDSGDLAALSIKARQLLDEAGFTQTQIVGSNTLDEYVIRDLKNRGAKITVWGVGTHLATAYDCPALDGVYKLSALRDASGVWQYKLKLSEQSLKISNPGIYQIRRYLKAGSPVADMIFDTELGVNQSENIFAVQAPYHAMVIPDYETSVDLLQPVFKQGQCVYPSESTKEMRDRSIQQLTAFLKTQENAIYPVGLEKSLHDLKQQLIVQIRNKI